MVDRSHLSPDNEQQSCEVKGNKATFKKRTQHDAKKQTDHHYMMHVGSWHTNSWHAVLIAKAKENSLVGGESGFAEHLLLHYMKAHEAHIYHRVDVAHIYIPFPFCLRQRLSAAPVKQALSSKAIY